jgi:transposase
LRWQIELFFKWVKGNLKIKPFISKSENGVKMQIIIAMICYLLIRLAQNKINIPACSITIVTIVISRHLYVKKPIKKSLYQVYPSQ